MPSLRRPLLVLWGAGLAVVSGCAGTAGLPHVAVASLVPIGAHRIPAPAAALPTISNESDIRTVLSRVGAFPSGSELRIGGVRDGRPTRYVAFLLDGRLWCPQPGRAGGAADFPRPLQTLDVGKIGSVEIVRDSAAAPYARRCAVPVEAVVRVRTGTAGRG
jgi:hypothetical protein